MPVIQLHLPDTPDFSIPDGCQAVADWRKPQLGELIFVDGSGFIRVRTDCTMSHPVLRKAWEPPPRLKGIGFWLAEDANGDQIVYTHEPVFDRESGEFKTPCQGDRNHLWVYSTATGPCIDADWIRVLGLTEFPDLKHLPPSERKVKL